PQARVALGGAVLQRGRALRGDQLADHVADDIERKRGHVRRAPGQRYDLGPGRDGEQRPDFGSHHANRPLGVLADVTVDSLWLRYRRLFGCHGLSCSLGGTIPPRPPLLLGGLAAPPNPPAGAAPPIPGGGGLVSPNSR